MTDTSGTTAPAVTARNVHFLCSLLRQIRIEVLPNVDLAKVQASVPKDAVLTVTSSPAHGVQGTLETSLALRGLGYRVVPHLAARPLRDHHQVADPWAQYSAAGIDEIFVVGGDQSEPAGEFPHALSLLETLVELQPRPARLGVTAYPEGQPPIPLMCSKGISSPSKRMRITLLRS